MSAFWSLFERSVIIQGVITLVLIGVIAYQAIVGIETPELIETLTFLVVGFWFGSKVENARTNAVIKKLNGEG